MFWFCTGMLLFIMTEYSAESCDVFVTNNSPVSIVEQEESEKKTHMYSEENWIVWSC